MSVARALAAVTMMVVCGSCSSPAAVRAPAAKSPADDGAGRQAPIPAAAPATDSRVTEVLQQAINRTRAERHRCWRRAAADDFRLFADVLISVDFKEPLEVSLAAQGEVDAVLSECLVELFLAYPWPAEMRDMQVEIPFSFDAPRAQYAVNQADLVPFERNGMPAAAVWLDEQNTGSGVASVSRLLFQKDDVVAAHRHTVTTILYVVAGTLTISGQGQNAALVPGSVVFVPADTVHGLRASARSDVVQLFTPAGPEREYRKRPAPATLWGSEAAGTGKPYQVRQVGEVEPLSILGGKGSVRIVFDSEITEDTSAYVGWLEIGPSAQVPEHTHPTSSEILVLMDGSGRMTVAGQALSVAAGEGIHVPAATLHDFRTNSGTTLRALQFYTPAGPEQRFKKK